MKIRKLTLKNFRAYNDATIDFNDFNCIVGKNDVGKSTIFEALKLVFDKNLNAQKNDFYNRCENEEKITIGVEYECDFVEESSFLKMFSKDGKSISIQKQFPISSILKKADSDDFFYSILVQENSPLYYRISKNYNPNYTDEYNCLTWVLPSFDELRKSDYWIKTSDIVPSKKNSYFSDILSIINMPSFCFLDNLYSLDNVVELYTNKLQSSIANSFPNITFCELLNKMYLLAKRELNNYYNENEVIIDFAYAEYDLMYRKKNEQYRSATIIPTVKSRLNNGEYGSIENRGEGFRFDFRNFIWRLYTGDNCIFFFEEPETHLHPSRQIEYFESLKKLSNESQVFITTHSPTIVSRCSRNDIIHIKKDDNNFTVICQQNKTLKEVVEDLGINSNDILVSLLGSVKCLLLVEGPDDVLAFNHLCDKYKENGKIEKSFKDMGCAIIPTGGCDSIKHWSTFKVIEQLAKPFYIVLDSDKEDETTDSPNYNKLCDVYSGPRDHFQVLKKREIENYIPCDYFAQLEPPITIHYGDWDDVKSMCKSHSDQNRLGGRYVCKIHFPKLSYEQLRSTFCPDGQDSNDEFLDIYNKIRNLCSVN